MKKVITYGTYDLLHYGHIRLLERAKALGDFLVVGVTADGYDKARGKINVQQSLMERIEAVKETGIADEIIIEEYEGQKIDDIRRMGIDIFAIGSDWKGKFDYLNEYCKVVYLDRTQGVSSSELRSEACNVRIGIIGESTIIDKFYKESRFVNGVSISGFYTEHKDFLENIDYEDTIKTSNIEELFNISDALYVISHPSKHYEIIKRALEAGKHVLCESPIATTISEWHELEMLAEKNNLVLMDGIKTAYSTAYYHLLLLAKSGKVGNVVSVDATCTSLRDKGLEVESDDSRTWNSISAWGPTALLPIFQILGTQYQKKEIVTHLTNDKNRYDTFTKIDFIYPDSVASLKVGKGVKSEGELIISGTKGYIYVPAPWWKTDYFEIRYENPNDNKRYFYQLDGEGIRYEIVSFVRAITTGKDNSYVEKNVSEEIIRIIEDFNCEKDLIKI